MFSPFAMCAPLQDSCDEYERFADLLNACAGTTVGRQQAQEFFCMGNNRKPSKPDFNALHAAGKPARNGIGSQLVLSEKSKKAEGSSLRNGPRL